MKKITYNDSTVYIDSKTTNHNLFKEFFNIFPEKDEFVMENYFGKRLPKNILKLIVLTDKSDAILDINTHKKRKIFYAEYFLPLHTSVIKLFDISEKPQLPLNKWMFGPYLYAITLTDFEVNRLTANIRKKIHFLRITKDIRQTEYCLKNFPNLDMLSLSHSRCVGVKNHKNIKYLEIIGGYSFKKIKDFPNIEVLKLKNSMCLGISKKNPAQKKIHKLYLLNCPKMPKKIDCPNLRFLYSKNSSCDEATSEKYKFIKE